MYRAFRKGDKAEPSVFWWLKRLDPSKGLAVLPCRQTFKPEYVEGLLRGGTLFLDDLWYRNHCYITSDSRPEGWEAS